MLQDYLYKFMADRWTRVLVMLLLLALLAFQLSTLIWNFFPGPSSSDNGLQIQISNSDASVAPQQSYLEKAQLIGRAYLFGKPTVATAPEDKVEAAPETRLNYKLRGIYYSDQSRLSSAIIEIKVNDSNYYRLNDELADNITLAAIEPDHILISRYGKLERLNLEKSTNTGASSIINRRSSDPSSSATSALLRSYKRRYVSNPLALANRFQAIPVSENGQNIGFKLKALRGESLLKKLNFQDSDVFTSINGIGLDKPFEALDALKSLTTAPSVTVTVLRNGNQETFNFSLE